MHTVPNRQTQNNCMHKKLGGSQNYSFSFGFSHEELLAGYFDAIPINLLRVARSMQLFVKVNLQIENIP